MTVKIILIITIIIPYILNQIQDDSVIFKAQIMPKEFEEIWVEVFNYINNIVNILKPNKMIFLALDGVAPRSKMNNQRSRRFKSARDYK